MISKKRILIALALLAIAVTIMIAGGMDKTRGEAGPGQQPATAPTAAPSAPIDNDTPANTAPPLPEDLSERITAAVQGFIAAYGTQRWDDATPTSWLERTKQFSTTDYAEKLDQLFARAGAGPAWEAFVEQHTVRQPTIDELRIVQQDGISKGVGTVIVSYRISTSSDETDATAFESFNRMVQLVTVNKEWLVDGFGPVAAGYAPEPGGTPTAPAQAPHIKD